MFKVDVVKVAEYVMETVSYIQHIQCLESEECVYSVSRKRRMSSKT